MKEMMKGKVFKWFVRLVVLGIAANVLLVAGVFVFFLMKRGELGRSLLEHKAALYGRGKLARKNPVKIYSGSNALIGEYLPERDSRLTMKRCEKTLWLRRAAVSAEDKDFYSHSGISLRGILRAFVRNIISLRVSQGAGTITQQLGRNLYTTRSAPALPRKIYETFVAFLIERRLSKKEILCLYLNKVYMGEGRVGAEEAARLYFKKRPERLTAAEAAMVVGLFPNPARYSPLNNIRRSMIKQKAVMNALVRDKHLKKNQAVYQLGKFIKFYGVESGKTPTAGRIGRLGASRDFRRNAAPAANEYVIQFLTEVLSEDVIRAGGLKVYTSIDYLRQRAAETVMRQTIRRLRASIRANRGNKRKLARIARRLNGVLIALDPATGEVRAVVGGYRVTEGGVMAHRAWKMRRQPGSSIKAFLYAMAMEKGILDLKSTVVDKPINIGGYKPKNWYPSYLGKISLHKAVALSVNTTAVTTLDKLGVGTFQGGLRQALDLDFIEARRRFPRNLTLALGSGEVTPLELARIYGMILNGGFPLKTRLIRRVEDAQGNVLWKGPENLVATERMLKAATCGKAIALMRGVFDERYRGTMKQYGRKQANLSFLPFNIAGKSGTVQSHPAHRRKFGIKGNRDAWFVGLVPNEVAVVWFGNDLGAPFVGGGSGTAGGTWVRYASSALPGNVTGKFPAVDQSDTPVVPDPTDTPSKKNDGPDSPFPGRKKVTPPKNWGG